VFAVLSQCVVTDFCGCPIVSHDFPSVDAPRTVLSFGSVCGLKCIQIEIMKHYGV
jgi:hypothetical protein